MVAAMQSSDFDSYLTVGRMVAGVTEYLKEDDDGGGERNARVRFTAPADGQYLLIAQALEEGSAGSFTLSLQQQAAPTTAERRTLRVGETVTGTLAETDAEMEDEETFYDTYVVQAAPGQRLRIDMRADSMDSYLSVGTERGGDFEELDSDDDGGGDLHARVSFTAPDDGPVVVRARALGLGLGDYTLSVTDRGPARVAGAPAQISEGQEVQGELTEEDGELEDESYYDYWVYSGQPGQRVRIDMASDQFDTFLAVGQLSGASFEEMASNDDGTDGTNSTVETNVPASGRLVIRANALTGGSTGAYRLRVQRVD